MDKKFLILFIIVLVIASFFRIWLINKFPSGLFPDEAANGQDALLILEGHHSPFFERGLGREALYFYLLSISIGLFGIGVWQIHIISALIGILTVVSTWFLAKELFNKRIAFLTSFFLAISTWHTTLSRTGFRAILVPLLSTLFFYFSYLVIKEQSNKKRLIFSILAGLSLGLGFYTYISFRAIVAIIGLLIIAFWIKKGKIIKNFGREIIISLIAAILVLSPLIVYFIHHPDYFFTRAGYVSIFNPDLNQGDLLGTFLNVAKKTFLMFITYGDINWRHNVSGFSVLNPLVSAFFLLGFLYCFFVVIISIFKFHSKKTLRYSLKYFFLIIWFLGMMGPEMLSAQGIPHALRAIGTIPAVFFFPAIIIDKIWQTTNNKKEWLKLAFSIFVGLILIISLVYNYALYFGISLHSPGFYYAYRSDLTTVSNYLNQRNLKDYTYLVLDEYSVQTPDFLTIKNHQPYIQINPWQLNQIKMLSTNDQVIFTQSTISSAKQFERIFPTVKIVKREFNQFGEEIMRVYQYQP